jgi:hypothetical protein
MDDYFPDDLQYSDDDDFQCVEDYDEDQKIKNSDDDFCIMDIENQKIDKLTKDMNNIKELLYKFDDTKLDELNNIKRDFYFLCDNNRYLIDDSMLLQKLEIIIYDNISFYEDKLFKIYQGLVDNEDELINKAALEKDRISYNKILKDCGLDKNDRNKIQIDMEKSKSIDEFIFSYDTSHNVDQSKEHKEIKYDYKKTNDFKNINDLNAISELKDEYYRRIDIIMERNGTLSEKLSDGNNINVFEIKEKLNLLQNRR